jgi:hypothetical protein
MIKKWNTFNEALKQTILTDNELGDILNIAKDEGFCILLHNPPRGHINVQLIIHIVNAHSMNIASGKNTEYLKDNKDDFIPVVRNISDRIKDLFPDVVLKTNVDDEHRTVRNGAVKQILINNIDELKDLEQIYLLSIFVYREKQINENLDRKEIDDVLNIARDEGLPIFISPLTKHQSDNHEFGDQIVLTRYVGSTRKSTGTAMCSSEDFL